MAITDVTVFSSIEVLENGIIQVRRTRRLIDNNELVGERHHRFILEPGQDVSQYPIRIQRIANAVWTPQVITDYQAAKAAITPSP